MTEQEQAAFDAGAAAMKEAIDAKLKAWHDWIKREVESQAKTATHSQQMTLCAYAGARMVAHLTNLPNKAGS